MSWFLVHSTAFFSFKLLEALQYFTLDKKIEVAIKCLPILSLTSTVYGKFNSFRDLKQNQHGFGVFVGLIFSAVADGFLVYGDETNFFLAGLGLFMMAVTSYMQAFGWKKLNLKILPITFVLSIIVYYFVFWKESNIPFEIKLGCLIYVLLGQTAIWRAWARVNWKDVQAGNYNNFLAGIGVISFAFSDMTLAINKFSFPIRHSSFIVMSSYYFAQFAISSAVKNDKKKAH